MIKRPTNIYDQYHAHVYFDGSALAEASSLCQKAGELFGVKVGRVSLLDRTLAGAVNWHLIKPNLIS